QAGKGTSLPALRPAKPPTQNEQRAADKLEWLESGRQISRGKRQGQSAKTHARGVEDRIGKRRGKADDGRFARARRGQVFAVEQHDLDRRHIAEAGHAVAGEAVGKHLAPGEVDLL